MKTKGIMKKAIAVILGITMAFGALALPAGVYRDQFSTASAYSVEYNGCKFYYTEKENRGVKMVVITSVTLLGDNDTVEIPSTVNVNGSIKPVYGTDSGFLNKNQKVKTVIYPATLKSIGNANLSRSSVENIVLPDSLEEIGANFASNCSNLKSVKYNGTGIKEGKMGDSIFQNSDLTALTNDKGAVCMGNWLIKYTPKDTVTSVKIADLGNDGMKIENMAYQAFCIIHTVKTVDLEGIKIIEKNNFSYCKNLSTVLNSDEVEYVAGNNFQDTPWYSKEKEKGLVKVGKSILYYKTNASSLDLTKGKFAGTKSIGKEALVDCENLDTIYCNSDCNFSEDCFYVANELRKPGFVYNEDDKDSVHTDPMPENSVYKIKNVYLDGEKLTASRLMNDNDAYDWMSRNRKAFSNSDLTKAMFEEKTKDLFDQLDITYYGEVNDKIGTLTPEEEFYIRLKVHNYLSIYDYDHDTDYGDLQGGFLLGGKFCCTEYAEMAHYMLECAGVETKTFVTDLNDTSHLGIHFWNGTKIGNEWFVTDDGWDAQNSQRSLGSIALDNSHRYGWFLNSYSVFSDGVFFHNFFMSYDSFHFYPESRSYENVTAERYYGDIDGNDKRDTDDVEILWDYVKGNTFGINFKDADMNFDGDVDVTDAVLLDRMVNGTALDKENIPTDGLAPGVQVAFLNGDDYDNIQYLWTERGGYITLPKLDLEAPEGKKLSYDVGMVGQRVRLTTPYQVIHVKWIDENTPDYSEPDSTPDDSSTPDKKDGILGDVNGDGAIDIEDAVMVINHVNGQKALTNNETKRADIDKNSDIDIEDAVAIVAHINGVKPIE